MASMFPTALAMRHAKALGIQSMITHEHELSEAMKDFQKVAVVSEFENAIIILKAHIVRGELDEEQIAGLQVIFDFTEIEVDGIIIDRIGGVVREAKIEANKINAAQVFNEIRNGDSGNVKGAVKKVIFELDTGAA